MTDTTVQLRKYTEAFIADRDASLTPFSWIFSVKPEIFLWSPGWVLLQLCSDTL